MEYSTDSEKYELNGPPGTSRENYGAVADWDVERDTEAFVDKEHGAFSDSDEDNVGGVTSSFPYESKGLYFRDGRRKIDFVLVYEELKSDQEHNKKKFVDMQSQRNAQERHERWRTKFMGNLRKIGLDMEEEVVETDISTSHFIKLCAPWAVLVHYAEELSLRAPLQAYPCMGTTWTESVLQSLKFPNLMIQTVPCQPLHYFTCRFKKSKIDKFLGSDNHDNYFTNTQRSRIVYEILQTSAYGKRRQAEIGIDRMVDEGAYSAAFPLHEGSYKISRNQNPQTRSKWNRRQILFEFWAKWTRWYKYQPLDHVREYFGEKIAYYFAWLGFYNGWLIPAAIVGVVVFLFGVASMKDNRVALQVCNSGQEYKMCPLCDESDGCSFWYLSDVCGLTQLSYLFDHPGTVFYAVFVSFWSVLFLEYWKRTSISLAHYWDCMDLDQDEDRPRPQFVARAAYMERNPVTGIREPAFPKRARLKRIAVGMGIIMVMISLVVIFIIAVILYRIIVSVRLFQNPSTRAHASFVVNISGAVVQLIIIMILGKVYEKLAQLITDWEMHRTESQYEDHFTFKVFIFQFVNFYSAILYIAFFKGRYAGYPGHYNSILGLRHEICNPGGCLVELAQQLAVIMIGKQVINNTVEVLIPKIQAYFHRRRVHRLTNLTFKTRWEEDYALLPYEGLFSEYLEMIIQYGFITIFVAAFPLAPLFALLNNWVELRLDAQKLICETRRVIAGRAQNIGIWFTILESLTQLAVISNAFLIAFTSDFLPRIVYMYGYNWNLDGYVNFTLAVAPVGAFSEECRYIDFRDPEGNHTNFHWTLLAIRLAFVIIFEHVIFGISRLIDVLVPDVPESLDIKMRRERYLAKQALTDSDSIIKLTQQMGEEEANENET